MNVWACLAWFVLVLTVVLVYVATVATGFRSRSAQVHVSLRSLYGSLPKWYKGYHSNTIRDHHVVSDIKIFVDSLYARVLKLCVVWESLHSITQGVLSHGKGIAKRSYENGRNRT